MLKGHGELRMANQKTLAYDGVMARIAQEKNGFAPKSVLAAACPLSGARSGLRTGMK